MAESLPLLYKNFGKGALINNVNKASEKEIRKILMIVLKITQTGRLLYFCNNQNITIKI